MVVASGRWLGVRLDFLSELFICAVSLMAVVFSQNAGENLLWDDLNFFSHLGETLVKSLLIADLIA